MNNNGSRLTHGRTSVYNLNYHLIWCTKYRNKVLKGQVEQDLKYILYQIANENGYSIDHMEVGLDDHIHLLVSAPPKISVSSIAKQLKGTSSLRLFNMHPHLAERYWKPKTKRSIWSPSYYVESIGAVNEQAVAKYIDDQRKKEVTAMTKTFIFVKTKVLDIDTFEIITDEKTFDPEGKRVGFIRTVTYQDYTGKTTVRTKVIQ